jgi:hypothetical protein
MRNFGKSDLYVNGNEDYSKDELHNKKDYSKDELDGNEDSSSNNEL